MSALLAALALASATTLPVGTRIPARMNTSIGTASALGPDRISDVTRAGEPWAASVEAPIGVGCAGLDAGAVVNGRIATLAPGTGAGAVKLTLDADSLDGRALHAHVVAEPERVQSTDLGKRADSAAFTGILVGAIFFGVPAGLMIGYGVGGGAAAIDTIHERRVEAWLPAGTTVEVELDEPLTLPTRRAC
ncbi:MAG TPA: hypothetical protein VGH63_10000 [Polyangia bacterium]|jgi:hypothetical protein